MRNAFVIAFVVAACQGESNIVRTQFMTLCAVDDVKVTHWEPFHPPADVSADPERAKAFYLANRSDHDYYDARGCGAEAVFDCRVKRRPGGYIDDCYEMKSWIPGTSTPAVPLQCIHCVANHAPQCDLAVPDHDGRMVGDGKLNTCVGLSTAALCKRDGVSWSSGTFTNATTCDPLGPGDERPVAK
jgi:hypothetical protein